MLGAIDVGCRWSRRAPVLPLSLAALLLSACDPQQAPPQPRKLQRATSPAPPLPEIAQPSFDCAKAKTLLEVQVCSDPSIAEEDRKMASAYKEALGQTPKKWRGRVVASQRNWLAFVSRFCSPESIPDGSDRADCLREELHRRQIDVTPALVVKNSRHFLSVTRYWTTPREPEDATDTTIPRLIAYRVSDLELIEPKTAAERRLNLVIKKRLVELAKDTTLIRGETSAFPMTAGVDAVEIVLRRADQNGAGGESINVETMLWSFRLGRAITLADLIKESNFDKVARLAFEDTRREAKLYNEELESDINYERFRKIVRQRGLWSVSREGMSFSDNEGRRDSQLNRLGSNLTWSTLRPYLQPDLPFDPSNLSD